jgi:hypothetical protein
MGKIFALFTGAFAIVCCVIAVFVLAAWVQGIALAFSASTLLGIICIFIEIPFPLFGIAYWITGVDLAQRIVHALPQIFGN